MYRTKKGAKMGYFIFATLTTFAFLSILILGLNVVTLMFWLTSLIFLVNTGAFLGFLERIEDIESKAI